MRKTKRYRRAEDENKFDERTEDMTGNIIEKYLYEPDEQFLRQRHQFFTKIFVIIFISFGTLFIMKFFFPLEWEEIQKDCLQNERRIEFERKTELVDEMAKVKDDFKIMSKDTIEDMLKDMTQEEKEVLLRLYIFEK